MVTVEARNLSRYYLTPIYIFGAFAMISLTVYFHTIFFGNSCDARGGRTILLKSKPGVTTLKHHSSMCWETYKKQKVRPTIIQEQYEDAYRVWINDHYRLQSVAKVDESVLIILGVPQTVDDDLANHP